VKNNKKLRDRWYDIWNIYKNSWIVRSVDQYNFVWMINNYYSAISRGKFTKIIQISRKNIKLNKVPGYFMVQIKIGEILIKNPFANLRICYYSIRLLCWKELCLPILWDRYYLIWPGHSVAETGNSQGKERRKNICLSL
jgi:hypothetical protein